MFPICKQNEKGIKKVFADCSKFVGDRYRIVESNARGNRMIDFVMETFKCGNSTRSMDGNQAQNT